MSDEKPQATEDLEAIQKAGASPSDADRDAAAASHAEPAAEDELVQNDLGLVPVRLTQRFGSHNPNEVAGFPLARARQLVSSGAAVPVQGSKQARPVRDKQARPAKTKEA